jgi:hypothetical protein
VRGGGYKGSCLSTYALYISAANIWTTFPPLPSPMDFFPMITPRDNEPLFGGANYIVYTAYTFDTTNREWPQRTPMDQALCQAYGKLSLENDFFKMKHHYS